MSSSERQYIKQLHLTLNITDTQMTIGTRSLPTNVNMTVSIRTPGIPLDNIALFWIKKGTRIKTNTLFINNNVNLSVCYPHDTQAFSCETFVSYYFIASGGTKALDPFTNAMYAPIGKEPDRPRFDLGTGLINVGKAFVVS